ncbi:MAG: YDG domain-containing protein [Clostridia bacterium]|nr:YDG domain-containing protein [Clostridia bacterium]
MSKKQITAISVTAKDKAYDGTVNAEVTVGELTEVLAADKPYVSVLGTAEFASADAGNDIVVTYTAQGLTGSASGNYALAASTATDTANITPANVDFVFGTLDYVYDTNTKTVPISATLNGAVFTNYTVSYTQGGNQVIPTAVGEYDIEIGLSGNYTGAPTGVKLNIISASQAQLIISGLSGTLDYDREFTLRTVGGSGSGVVSWTSSDTAIATVSDTGAVKIVGVGSVTITATKQSDGNYNEQTADISFDTTKKAVSFRLSGLSKTYDGNAQYAAVDTSVTENDYTVTYTDEAGYTVTEPREAGTYYVEVAAIGNYEGSASGVMTIAKARITGITAANVVMDGGVYGEVLIGAYLSGVTTPSGVTVAVTYAGAGIYTPQSALPTNAGSYTAIVTLSGNNYETLTLTKAFEITKKTLTVTAEDKTVKFGMPNPEFTLVYSGFVTGDDANVFIVAPIASTARAPQSAVGDYDIVVSGGRADNYEFDYVSGALTVSQYSETGTTLTLTGSKATAKVGEEFTVIARYGSEYPTIVWYSSDERVATVTDGVVKAIATGAVTITATIDDSRYETKSVDFNLVVIREPVTVTLSAGAAEYAYGTAKADITGAAGYVSSNGESLQTLGVTIVTDYEAGDNVGRYELYATVTDNVLYEISVTGATFKIVPKTLTASDFDVFAREKNYDGTTDAVVTAVVKDASKLSGDVLTVEVTGSFDDANAGNAKRVSYAITGLGGADSGNYAIAATIQGSTSANITKAQVTLSAPSNTSYVYDGEEKSVNVVGYVAGMVFQGFSVTYDGSAALPTEQGVYDVDVTLDDPDNYEIAQNINSTLTIKSAAQDVFTIEGIPDSVSYGDTLTLSAAGAPTGSAISYQVVSGNAQLTGNSLEITGTGTVQIKATSTLANYEDKTATRTFTVGRKVLSPMVRLARLTREYDGTTDIDVAVDVSAEVLAGDNVSASATGAMATADAGTGKTVFVSGITLGGADKDKYTLSITTIHSFRSM